MTYDTKKKRRKLQKKIKKIEFFFKKKKIKENNIRKRTGIDKMQKTFFFKTSSLLFVTQIFLTIVPGGYCPYKLRTRKGEN